MISFKKEIKKNTLMLFLFPRSFLAVNHHINENWVPSILTHNLWLIFMGMKQKKNFFDKKKIKMADSKTLSFSKSPILKKNLWKFYGLVLMLWVRRNNWCKGLYGCSSTYIDVVRLYFMLSIVCIILLLTITYSGVPNKRGALITV